MAVFVEMQAANERSTERRIVGLTFAFIVTLWGMFAYWAVTSRHETISRVEEDLMQMTHAVEQYAANVFNMAEVFHATTERWLLANPDIDPLRDARFSALVEDFRLRTSNLIDVRLIKSTGDLHYFPPDPKQAVDNVADREYFRAVIDSPAGRLHIGMPVVSRVSGQWRLPVTLRMKQPVQGIEVINASINLSTLVETFDAGREKPNGSIALFRSDGVLLARAPFVQESIGKAIGQNSRYWETLIYLPFGSFVDEKGPVDGAPRLVGHARIRGLPLVVAVTSALSDALETWFQLFVRVLAVLALVSVVLCASSLRLLKSVRMQAEYAMELERLANTDALTGVFNRRAFVDAGDREYDRVRRYGGEMSMLMLDIDHFKAVNDNWGHPAGDRVLQSAASVFVSGVRQQDVLGRVGGEEFAVILPETDGVGAAVIAERIRAAIERTAVVLADDGSVVSITLSVGVATLCSDDASFADMMSRADKGLYLAKDGGRNCAKSY